MEMSTPEQLARKLQGGKNLKTRVLFAIGSMDGGGSEKQMLSLMKNIDRDRYEPELYLVSGGGVLFSQIPDDMTVHIHQERIRPGQSVVPGSTLRAVIRDLAQVLEERRIDIIWDRTYHMTIITAGAVRLRPTPRVSIIVCDPKLDFETNVERFRLLKRRALRRAYRDADVAACVSEGVEKCAASYHRLPRKNFEVIYNSFDVQLIRQRSRESVSDNWQKTTSTQRITAVGRLHTQKGYDILIDATRKLVHDRQQMSLELLILGRGPLESELRLQIRRRDLEDHVHLLGFVDNPLPIMKSADVHCLASRYEGMPNVLVEAILCGVPVVSADCPSGPREILEDGKWGALVTPEDSEALAAALEKALQERDKAFSVAAGARRATTKKFSLSAGLDRVDELIDLAKARFRRRHT